MAEMMAPSHDTSYKVYTPVMPTKAVQVVMDLLIDAIQPLIAMPDQWQSLGSLLSPSCPVCAALPMLTSSEAHFLATLSNPPHKYEEGLELEGDSG